MSGSRSLLIRADCLLTLDGPAVEGGALLVEGDTIRAVGPVSEIEAPGAEVIDLCGLTLLPGLINAHCHLDYTCLRGKLPRGVSFSRWALAIIAAKRRLRVAAYEASVRAGLDELLRHGTTTVFEVSCHAGRYAVTRLLGETPLRVAFFGEVLGLNPFGAGRRMRLLRRALDELDGPNVVARGMSPHAVYSLSRRLVKLVGRELARRPMPLAVHLLESRDEPRLNPWYDPQRAVKILDELGLLGRSVLGIHVNYPDDEDVAILAERGVCVVHCPGSHRFFGHEAFPAERLRAAGIPICLGTDSLASNERLDMLREMRIFLDAHPGFTAEEALRMATTAPAAFLSMTGRLGVLAAGAYADAIAVPSARVHSRPCSSVEACASIIAHEGEVAWVMVGGSVVHCP
jgi:cytosine/adenosine deaminase-related metal-dependent hydrolase